MENGLKESIKLIDCNLVLEYFKASIVNSLSEQTKKLESDIISEMSMRLSIYSESYNRFILFKVKKDITDMLDKFINKNEYNLWLELTRTKRKILGSTDNDVNELVEYIKEYDLIEHKDWKSKKEKVVDFNFNRTELFNKILYEVMGNQYGTDLGLTLAVCDIEFISYITKGQYSSVREYYTNEYLRANKHYRDYTSLANLLVNGKIMGCCRSDAEVIKRAYNQAYGKGIGLVDYIWESVRKSIEQSSYIQDKEELRNEQTQKLMEQWKKHFNGGKASVKNVIRLGSKMYKGKEYNEPEILGELMSKFEIHGSKTYVSVVKLADKRGLKIYADELEAELRIKMYLKETFESRRERALRLICKTLDKQVKSCGASTSDCIGMINALGYNTSTEKLDAAVRDLLNREIDDDWVSIMMDIFRTEFDNIAVMCGVYGAMILSEVAKNLHTNILDLEGIKPGAVDDTNYTSYIKYHKSLCIMAETSKLTFVDMGLRMK